ncbi:hypothetical protein ANANG_G00055130 [Anguilla anguilla]|uniref:Immunoglobulin V-set domain-containing protein n=1 Tax=Anguilla anguilla TaxID=7936 RepID=A0A9D3S4I0_ANGAN|nr:hypothetical protein ANANG_G00055130 [Anguilla anguilla]
MIPALITLISLCTHAGRALRVQQPYRVEARDGEARLRCSYAVRGSPEEMRLTLYRGKFGDDLVCQRTFNTTQSHFQTDGPVVRCRGELTPGAWTSPSPGCGGRTPTYTAASSRSSTRPLPHEIRETAPSSTSRRKRTVQHQRPRRRTSPRAHKSSCP